MEISKILTASYLDLVFDGRNKSYGAYELRSTEASRVWKALGCTGLIILVAGLVMLFGESKAAPPEYNIHEGVNITSIEEPEKVPEKIPEPLPEPKTTPQQVKVEMIKLTAPNITDDKNVVNPPPAQSELDDVKIGTANREGIKGGDIVNLPEQFGDGQGIVAVVNKQPKEETEFIKIEQEASYIGGTAAWMRYLDRNLSTEIAVDNGAPEGTYKVLVKFVVDVNGKVSDIVALSKVGYGMEDEAIRVIKKSGKWNPAIQNGTAVKAHRTQPITFRVLAGE